MKWNFPITKAIRCQKCGKQFTITLRSKQSTKHPCPNCGTVHNFDFDAVEKTILKEAKDAVRKAFPPR
jgi:phage FluMu protein Com